jgi:alanine dehydrogenase
MPALILTRGDIGRNASALTLLEDLRQALIKGEAEAAAAIPATVVTVSEGAQPLIHLYDRPGGKLLAVMDAEPVQLLRTQLVAALAVDALASPEAKRVALLGGGPVASATLKALRLVRSLRQVSLVMPDISQQLAQAAQLQQTLNTPVRPVGAAADAVDNADIVILCEGVALPEVALWPSVHLCVPSTTGFATAPFTPGVLAKAWRVSDAPAEQWGQSIQAELGAVLRGSAERPSGVNTLFLGCGPAWLDLVTAWHVYLGAVADEPQRSFEA